MQVCNLTVEHSLSGFYFNPGKHQSFKEKRKERHNSKTTSAKQESLSLPTALKSDANISYKIQIRRTQMSQISRNFLYSRSFDMLNLFW